MGQQGKIGLMMGALLLSSVATAQQLSPKEAFAKYDANGDGYNDVSEYVRAGDESFREWDLNRDGYLTPAELGEAARPPGGTADIVMTVGRGLLAACDYDRDGKCSREEVRRQNREQLFPMMDQNKDGRLSFEEAMRYRNGGVPPAGR